MKTYTEKPSRPVSYMSRLSHPQLRDSKQDSHSTSQAETHGYLRMSKPAKTDEVMGAVTPKQQYLRHGPIPTPTEKISPLNPKFTDTWKDQRPLCNAPYQPVPITKQEVTLTCWVSSLSIQGKIGFPRKLKSLIYPQVLLGENSVVFEYKYR